MEEVVNTEVTADVTPTDSTPVETTPEVADEFDGLGDISLSNPEETTIKSESKAIESKDEDEKETDTQPLGKAEKRIQQLESEIEDGKSKLGIDKNTEIRDLVAARSAIQKAVTEANAKVYQPANEDELLEQVNPDTGEYYTKLEADVAVIKQTNEIKDYNNQVAEAQLVLTSEANAALRDFPIFDENSPEYDKETTARADKILGGALIFDDKTKQPIGSRMSTYEIYKTFADEHNAAVARGQAKAQKATEKMLANTDQAPGLPSKGSSNPLDDLFDKIKDVKFSS